MGDHENDRVSYKVIESLHCFILNREVQQISELTLKSLSTTHTDFDGILEAKKYALELPMTPPPTSTTSYRDEIEADSSAAALQVTELVWFWRRKRSVRAGVRAHTHLKVAIFLNNLRMFIKMVMREKIAPRPP